MKWRIWLALFSIYIIWGSTYLAIQFAIESMPPFLMASLRFLVAGGILYVWRILAGDRKREYVEGVLQTLKDRTRGVWRWDQE